MQVFLTGATGWVGSLVARDLLDAGHDVVGLVRSASKGAQLAAVGVTPLQGAIDDLALLGRAADEADAVIHTAFAAELGKIVEASEAERRAIGAMGAALVGSDRPIVVTGGIGLAAPEQIITEADPQPVMPDFPRYAEQSVLELADRGVHASIVRLPRSVHGLGETHGFIPMVARLAREKGVSAYIDNGENLWPAVHRKDAARVFQLALKRSSRGEAYHAVAEQGVTFRLIAEAIGAVLGIPVSPLASHEAPAHFGGLTKWVAGNGPASSDRTRAVLGWEPQELKLIEDIGRPAYLH